MLIIIAWKLDSEKQPEPTIRLHKPARNQQLKEVSFGLVWFGFLLTLPGTVIGAHNQTVLQTAEMFGLLFYIIVWLLTE